MSPVVGLATTFGALGGLLGLAAWGRRAGARVELTRKAVHVGMGTVALAFPWWFDRPWPVVVLAAAALAVLVPLRLVPSWRARVGGAIVDVPRRSVGEWCFPVAVATAFVWAAGDPVAYAVPIAILTYADATAALVGGSVGHLRYTTDEGTKTAEGSLAFFVVAFVATAAGLGLAGARPPAEIALIAAALGLVATLLEAMSRWGLDNLLVPLGALALLQDLRDRPEPQLWVALAVLGGLLAVVLAWRRRVALNDSALLAATVYGYVAFTLADARWVVPPLLLYLSHPLLAPVEAGAPRRVVDAAAVTAVGATGLGWLLLSRWLVAPGLFLPYTLAFAAHLAMICAARACHAQPAGGHRRAIAICALRGWAVSLAPFVAMAGGRTSALLAGVVALPGLLAATAFFARWERRLADRPVDAPRWWRQTAVALAASLLGLVPLPGDAT